MKQEVIHEVQELFKKQFKTTSDPAADAKAEMIEILMT